MKSIQQRLMEAQQTQQKQLAAHDDDVGIRFDKKVAKKKGKVTSDVITELRQFSSVAVQLHKAKKLGLELKSGKHFNRLLEHFLERDNKSQASKNRVAELITNYLENTAPNQDILNHCLMMAAKIGNLDLYNTIKAAHGTFINPNGTLVVDENNLNVLHYACQSDNANLVKQIADEMRKAENEKDNGKKLIAPEDSKVNGEFDPFRIRDDKSLQGRTWAPGAKGSLKRLGEKISSAAQINELRPIHFISYSLAQKLDEAYGLDNINGEKMDGKPGTFVSAYNLFRIENRVLANKNIDWLMQKKATYGEDVQETALKAKLYAGVGVANDPMSSMVLSNAAAAGLISAAALAFGLSVAAENRHMKKLAKAAVCAHEFVSLPSLDSNTITPVQGDYTSPKDKTRNIHDLFRDSNHNLMEALRVRDFATVSMIVLQRPYAFKKTTPEIIQAVKQIDTFYPPELKIPVYTALIEKIDYKSKKGITMAGQILDALYRPETKAENQQGKDLIELIKSHPNINQKAKDTISKEWEPKFEEQATTLTQGKISDKVKTRTLKSEELYSNKELIEAFENYDFYKIRHIIAHGEFNYTSKEVLHALEKMYVFPIELKLQTDIHLRNDKDILPAKPDGKIDNPAFMEFVFEGLAKKAGPKQFLQVLSHLINTRGQVETGKNIIKRLIERYDRNPVLDKDFSTENADRERLKSCALMAAGLGEIRSMQTALTALRERHGLNTLEVMDNHGNNILHYAAKSQDSNMIKYICQNTSLIQDFNLANQRVKAAVHSEGMIQDITDWAKHKASSEEKQMRRTRVYHADPKEKEYLSSVKKAETVFEIPNRDGKTPMRMIKNQATSSALGEFTGTVGFSLDAHEYRQKERDRKENRAVTVAQAGIIIAMLGASCGAIIPGAISIGTALGVAIASKLGLASVLPGFTIVGGVTEGATAVSLALATEHGLLPAFGKLGKTLYEGWDKAVNGTSMETLRDYDDRILIMSDQLTTAIANIIAGIDAGKEMKDGSGRTYDIKNYDGLMNLIAAETTRFIEAIADTDPTRKELAKLAAVNAALRILPASNPAQQATNEQLLNETRDMIFTAANTIDNKISTTQALDAFNAMTDYKIEGSLTYKIEQLEQSTVVLDRPQKTNKKIEDLLIYLDRLKEQYATKKDMKEMEEKNPAMSYNEIFQQAAMQKAKADYQRQIKLVTQPEGLHAAMGVYQDKLSLINKITSSYEKYANTQNSHLKSLPPEKAVRIIQSELRERLAHIEGGTMRTGPLTKCFDALFKDRNQPPSRDAVQTALAEAYKLVKHPQPEKALAMQRAIETCFYKLDVIRQPVLDNSITAYQRNESGIFDLTKDTNSLEASSQILPSGIDLGDPTSQSREINPPATKPLIFEYDLPDPDPSDIQISQNPTQPAILAHIPALQLCAAIRTDNPSQTADTPQLNNSSNTEQIREALVNVAIHALRNYTHDQSARDTVHALGIIQHSRTSSTIQIDSTWKDVFKNGSAPVSISAILLSAISSCRTTPTIAVPPNWEIRQNGSTITENTVTPITTSATYHNVVSNTEFSVNQNASGKFDLTVPQAPAITHDKDAVLKEVHDLVKQCIKYNGLDTVIHINGASSDLVNATLLICRANNLSCTIDKNAAPHQEPDASQIQKFHARFDPLLHTNEVAKLAQSVMPTDPVNQSKGDKHISRNLLTTLKDTYISPKAAIPNMGNTTTISNRHRN